MLADQQVGACRASGDTYYPEVGIFNPDTNTMTLRDWCKDWCAQVQPDKVVAVVTEDNQYGTGCYCYFSYDDLPAGFDGNAFAFMGKYDPDANWLQVGGSYTGTGCVPGTNGDPDYTCYPNCAYKQCVSIYACLS